MELDVSEFRKIFNQREKYVVKKTSELLNLSDKVLEGVVMFMGVNPDEVIWHNIFANPDDPKEYLLHFTHVNPDPFGKDAVFSVPLPVDCFHENSKMKTIKWLSDVTKDDFFELDLPETIEETTTTTKRTLH